MREYQFKNNNQLIISLIFSIGALILVNGAFVFWQMQQIKTVVEKVVHRDMPLVTELTPLIDRQFEQTLIIKQLSEIVHSQSDGQTDEVLAIFTSKFVRTSNKFEQTLDQMLSFVRVKMPAANKNVKAELQDIRQSLEQIVVSHQNYQKQVSWLVDGISGRSHDFNQSNLELMWQQEADLYEQLMALHQQVTKYTNQSITAVNYYDSLVVKETVIVTLVIFAIMTTLLFYVRQLMVSRARAVDEINYFATFDSLTKLLNRRYFNERFEQAIKAAIRHDQPLSLCVCDIDNFQHVKEKYGEHAGDLVLAGFADILAEQMRASDVAGRFGPDEFVMFFPNTSGEEATKMLERIRRILGAKLFCNDDDMTFRVTATFGVSQMSLDYRSSAAMYGAADKALCKAKEKGRDLIYAIS